MFLWSNIVYYPSIISLTPSYLKDSFDFARTEFAAIAPLPEVANFSIKYFILSKVYTDEGGIK